MSCPWQLLFCSWYAIAIAALPHSVSSGSELMHEPTTGRQQPTSSLPHPTMHRLVCHYPASALLPTTLLAIDALPGMQAGTGAYECYGQHQVQPQRRQARMPMMCWYREGPWECSTASIRPNHSRTACSTRWLPADRLCVSASSAAKGSVRTICSLLQAVMYVVWLGQLAKLQCEIQRVLLQVLQQASSWLQH